MMKQHFCPDCGEWVAFRLIEKTEPDLSGEYKDCCTCDNCDNMVYIVRNTDNPKNAEWDDFQTEE